MINTELAAGVRFAGTIRDIEVKSHEYPLDLDEVRKYIDDADRYVYLARIGKRDIGVACCINSEDVVWMRLGVLPSFRKLGVARKLLSVVAKRGQADKAHCLKITIPSYRADDKEDPDYIGAWMKDNEFLIAGCKTNHFFRYGKLWDGYVFGALL